MARSNVLTTAKRIRRHLGPGHRQEVAQLLDFTDASQTSILFAGSVLPTGVAPGVTLGIDLELLRVVSVDTAGLAATVIRGFLDSDADTHDAGAQIDVAPRFSMLDIVDAMMSEIDSWGQQLYYTTSDTFSVATSDVTLELPAAWTSLLGVIACNQSETASFTTGATVWPELPARLIRGTPTDFDGALTSGILLRFLEPIRTGAVYIVAAMPFRSSGMLLTQDLGTDFHLPDSMLDVLEMGTTRRLILNSDAARGSRVAQDEARRAEETPVGSMVSLDQLQLAQYRLRKAEEVRLLRRNYPIRIT
jgi:hypothetical protein